MEGENHFPPPRCSIATAAQNSAPKHFFDRFPIPTFSCHHVPSPSNSKDQTQPSRDAVEHFPLSWRQIQQFLRLQKSANPGKRSGLLQTNNLNNLSPASDLRRIRKSSWTGLRFSLLQRPLKTRRPQCLLPQNKDARTKGDIIALLKAVVGQLAPAYYGIAPCLTRCISIIHRHVLKASQR